MGKMVPTDGRAPRWPLAGQVNKHVGRITMINRIHAWVIGAFYST